MDDVSDTGESLKVAMEHMVEKGVQGCHDGYDLLQATQYPSNQISSPESTSAWIIFPWERLEATKLLIQEAKLKGRSLDSVRETLDSVRSKTETDRSRYSTCEQRDVTFALSSCPSFPSMSGYRDSASSPTILDVVLRTVQQKHPEFAFNSLTWRTLLGSRYLVSRDIQCREIFSFQATNFKNLGMEILLYVSANRQISEAIQLSRNDFGNTRKSLRSLVGKSDGRSGQLVPIC